MALYDLDRPLCHSPRSEFGGRSLAAGSHSCAAPFAGLTLVVPLAAQLRFAADVALARRSHHAAET